MSEITLIELLKTVGVTPSQLDNACTREHLQDIALFLESWRTVAPRLGLSGIEVEEVERDGREEKEKRQKILEVWKAKYSFEAKYRVLVEVLLKIGRADQAMKVCCVLITQKGQFTPPLEAVPPTLPPLPPPTPPNIVSVNSPQLSPIIQELPSQAPTNHLEGAQVQPLCLEEEIKQFEEKYEDLVNCVLIAFQTGGVSIGTVLKCLRQLPVSLKLQFSEFLQSQAARLSRVSNISELFFILSPHWNFLNPSLLAYLAHRFGDDQTISSVEQYLGELREFRMRTKIDDFINRWTGTLLPDTQEIVMELGENWREKSLEQLEELRIKFSRKQCFADYVMPLKGIKAASVDAVFSLPESVDIPSLELESFREFFQEHQVLRILLNGECILNLQLQQSGNDREGKAMSLPAPTTISGDSSRSAMQFSEEEGPTGEDWPSWKDKTEKLKEEKLAKESKKEKPSKTVEPTVEEEPGREDKDVSSRAGITSGRAESPLSFSKMAGDFSEGDPETMTEHQKSLLTEHHAALVGGMNPMKVVEQLQKREILALYDKESILTATTALEMNDRLMQVIEERSKEAIFLAFADALRMIDSKHAALADKLSLTESEVADDSSEEDPETMTERQKDLLTEHHAALAEGMNPMKVVGHLQRRGILDRYDKETILAATTTLEKNDRLIEVIIRRSRKAFHAFADALRAIDSQHAALAEKLLPIRFRVLWFAASASEAAAVVYVLEKYANTLFSGVETSVGCLFRRGRAFDVFGGMACLEVWLVFPLDEKPESLAEAMVAAFKSVCPHADMALMSGVCKGVGEGVRSGDLVVANLVVQLNSVYPIGPRQDHVEKLEHHLQDLIVPSWLEEVNSALSNESSKQYQTLWLTRLYLELQKVENGQRSQWLATDSLVGWETTQSLKCKENQTVLARNLPDWEGGRLAAFLLEERELWQSDHSSPLGMSPRHDLLTAVEKRLVTQADYPTPARPPHLVPPHFGIMATEPPTSREGGTQLPSPPLVHDDNCYQFYSLCHSELGGDKPWFVCKGVGYELGGSQTLCVISSTCLLTEAMKVFAGLQREAQGPY